MTARTALVALALLALTAGRAAAGGAWRPVGDSGWKVQDPDGLGFAGGGAPGQPLTWSASWESPVRGGKGRRMRQHQTETLEVFLERPMRPMGCEPGEPSQGRKAGRPTLSYLCPPLGLGAPVRHFVVSLDDARPPNGAAIHVVYRHAWDPPVDALGGFGAPQEMGAMFQARPPQMSPHLKAFFEVVKSLRPAAAEGKVLAAGPPGLAPPPGPPPPGQPALMDDALARAIQGVEEARGALDHGQGPRALELLGRSLEAHPTPQAYYLRSWLLHGMGRDAEARLDAQAGLALAPGDPNLRAALDQAQPQTAVLLRDAPQAAGPAVNPAAGPITAPPAAPASPVSSVASAARQSPLPVPEPPAASGSATLLFVVIGAIVLVVGGALAVGVGLGAFLGRRKAASAAAAPAAPSPTRTGEFSTLAPPPRPASLGRYELGRQIGIGGMGVVYEGRDKTLGRRVAIKQMRPELKDNPTDRARFLGEAQIVAKLSHPYIVAFHEIVEQDNEIFLVFDYVDGVPLSTMLRSGRLPLPLTQRIFAQVCEAISCAHRAHVLHRDLKPANIMIGNDGYVKVMDFGIARQAKETITRLTLADEAGTPAYMAPEQHLGHCAKTSDIYALGVCLYETLTGQLPFQGPDFLAQKERMLYPPPQTFAPDLPKVAELLFQITLSYDPAKRVADAEELIDSIKQLG